MSPANPDSQPHGDEGETGDGDAGRPAASAPSRPEPQPQYPAQTWPPPYPGYPATPAARRRPGRALLTGAAVVLALVVLGAPLGLLWTALAPAVPVIKVDGGVQPVQPQPEELIAADGWFSLLGLGFGVLAAIVVWLVVRRYRGPIGLIAVGLGGLGAAVVAWRVGRLVGLDTYRHLLASAPVDTAFTKPPDLRAGRFEWLYGFIPTLQGDLLLPAFGAIVTYTLLAGWSRWPSLRPEPAPDADWVMALPTPGGGLPVGAAGPATAAPAAVTTDSGPVTTNPGPVTTDSGPVQADPGPPTAGPDGPAPAGPAVEAAGPDGPAAEPDGRAADPDGPATARPVAGTAGPDGPATADGGDAGAGAGEPATPGPAGSGPAGSGPAGSGPASSGPASSGSAERPAPSAAPAPPGPDAAASPRD